MMPTEVAGADVCKTLATVAVTGPCSGTTLLTDLISSIMATSPPGGDAYSPVMDESARSGGLSWAPLPSRGREEAGFSCCLPEHRSCFRPLPGDLPLWWRHEAGVSDTLQRSDLRDPPAGTFPQGAGPLPEKGAVAATLAPGGHLAAPTTHRK